ncbi:GNAT family N-acetyltransferase [Roseibacillus ishigakijimensis]|uniref:GNAT family N-acetyltransferase n=1 Tax=Roseibacillus ishigakijimensis TaxID=454146 RepID=A0A934VN66_9BACT|nr:GNAT family N-acetyltransferase [Roseibacillus ishigakijimensis]MBK1834992.1 GNAT family N-acetyltransferase [Roseibacillus ishigakijimensis]
MSEPSLDLTLRPARPGDFPALYDLRWRVLRAPWQQPRGSEQDELEEEAYHFLAEKDAKIIAAGRLHPLPGGIWQIRYMAVAPAHAGQGLGRSILHGLEQHACQQGARRIILNARERAVPFYQKHGYQITAPGPLLWNILPHFFMEKNAPLPASRKPF